MPPASLPSVTATEAKNSLGAVLDRVLSEGGVAITKHDEVRAVLLSVREYERLVGGRHDPLAELSAQFDDLVARMQPPAGQRAGRALFAASGRALGRAASQRARRTPRD